MTGAAARDGSERHGRCVSDRRSAEIPRRNAVVPGAPTIGISCFAIEAPAWKQIMATISATTAVAVLLGVAGGALFGYRGSAIVTEGDDFSNLLTQYDDFASGSLLILRVWTWAVTHR